jgi:hypothetical protein
MILQKYLNNTPEQACEDHLSQNAVLTFIL